MDPALRRQVPGLGITGAGSPLFDELAEAVVDAAVELGVPSVRIVSAAEQAHYSRLVAVGTQGLLRRAAFSRPEARQAIWSGEPMPQPQEVFARRTLAARSRLFESSRRAFHALPEGRPRSLLGRLGGAAAEQQPWHNLSESLALARRCHVFVVTSHDQAAVMSAGGARVEVVPFGYSPRHHGELSAGGERDVHLLLLGGYSGPTCGRRRKWVERRRREGLGITVVEGLWGQGRTEMLRRTRVVVELHRFPGTFVGIRLVMALAAGAVVVSEPMTDPRPFVPGVHFVEAPQERMAAEARALLADESRRRRIAEAGQALLREELTMARSLSAVLRFLDAPDQGSNERTASIT